MNDKEHPARTTAVGMDRKLTAILAADVQGYSRLMGEASVQLAPYERDKPSGAANV